MKVKERTNVLWTVTERTPKTPPVADTVCGDVSCMARRKRGLGKHPVYFQPYKYLAIHSIDISALVGFV